MPENDCTVFFFASRFVTSPHRFKRDILPARLQIGKKQTNLLARARHTGTHHDDTTGPERGDCMLVGWCCGIGSTLIWPACSRRTVRKPALGRTVARHSLFGRYMKAQPRLAGDRRKLGKHGQVFTHRSLRDLGAISARLRSRLFCRRSSAGWFACFARRLLGISGAVKSSRPRSLLLRR